MGNGWPYFNRSPRRADRQTARCGAILGNDEELNKVDPVVLEALVVLTLFFILSRGLLIFPSYYLPFSLEDVGVDDGGWGRRPNVLVAPKRHPAWFICLLTVLLTAWY